MRATGGFLLLWFTLLAACGGGGGSGGGDGGPSLRQDGGPQDVLIDSTTASTASATLDSVTPVLAARSSVRALAAQVASAALKASTHATPVTLSANLVGGTGSRAALSSGPAVAFGFQVVLLNPPPSQAVTTFSGLLVLQSGGALVLAVGPSPGPNPFPAAVGILIGGGTQAGQIWTATQGNESVRMVSQGVACAGPLVSAVTDCNQAIFDGPAVPPSTQTGAELSITASQPEAGGATGSRTATVLPQGLVGVSLTVDCAVTTLCAAPASGGPPTFFFAANDGVHGVELWGTDGTSAGTVMVKDINPNAGSSNPRGFTPFNGFTYFAANDGSSGTELWRTDGTSAGTTRVADIVAGGGSSGPADFTVVGGALFFFAANGVLPGLWKTDGTTVVNVDLGTGVLGVGSLQEFGGGLFFEANTVASGRELWKSDGTASGTALLKDIDPGDGSSTPSAFTEFNGGLYFAANTGASGRELWKTDGTATGTTMVKDIAAGGGTSNPFNFIVAHSGLPGGDRLFFTAVTATTGAQLYLTDGTDVGTILVAGPAGSGFVATYLTVLNGQLYSACGLATGFGLCRSDGTQGGTGPVAPGTGPTSVAYITAAPALNQGSGFLLFQATASQGSSSDGNELWRSDGTAAGTVRVMDINPGTASSFPMGFHPVGNKVVFQATTSATGSEIWVTDGTTAGTQLLKDILPGPGSGVTGL